VVERAASALFLVMCAPLDCAAETAAATGYEGRIARDTVRIE